jgi:amino acid transporter
MAASPGARARKLTVVPLVAATYFMVSGGPYGLEELVAQAGYPLTFAILILTPIVWSLPTALMVGELGAAIPEDGGYYVWVRRALGPFWGFQEAWLSLMASVFDMAIYPTLFTLYLGRLWPAAASGPMAIVVGTLMIAVCTWWNVRGASAVGGASVVLSVMLLAPFVVLTLGSCVQPAHAAPSTGDGDLLGGIMIAMWNYMGWDNAANVAGEVDRPQRTYPLAILGTVGLVAATYVAPVAAAARAGLDPRSWTTGAWVDAGGAIGGRALAIAVIVGGMVCAVGMFNALVLSYSRLPAALAEDRLLPSAFARRHPESNAPWVAIVTCAACYTFCLGLGFKRLVALDVLLYGLSLLLEFVALVALRVREPKLERPFKIPGGLVGATLLGIGPTLLIAVAVYHERAEHAGPVPALALGLALVAGGPLVYFVGRRRPVAAPENLQ